MKKIFLVAFFSFLFCQMAFAGEWKTDENGMRYMQDDGTYVTGWHLDVDGVWYFFDANTGYLLTDTTTPDGYYVNASGAWVEEVVMAANLDSYDNCVELNVSTPKEQIIVYSGPLKVHYNNKYKNNPEGNLNVLSVASSKEGIPYIQINADSIGDYMTMKMTQLCKFTLSDGTIIDLETTIGDIKTRGENNYSIPILSGYEMYNIFRKNTIMSVEVWVKEYVQEN